jgi:hypothetical protein
VDLIGRYRMLVTVMLREKKIEGAVLSARLHVEDKRKEGKAFNLCFHRLQIVDVN